MLVDAFYPEYGCVGVERSASLLVSARPRDVNFFDAPCVSEADMHHVLALREIARGGGRLEPARPDLYDRTGTVAICLSADETHSQ